MSRQCYWCDKTTDEITTEDNWEIEIVPNSGNGREKQSLPKCPEHKRRSFDGIDYSNTETEDKE